jgi:hypothetical protein
MIPAREDVHDEGGIGMPHKNPWFLITLEEIAEIRRHLEILEENESEKSRENTGAITGILTTVEWRLRSPDDDKTMRCGRLSVTGGSA